MRLVNTRSLELAEFSVKNIPEYAILSHTWGDDEVCYDEMIRPTRPLRNAFRKIMQACSLMASESFEFMWIDTCCIDKKSSAELSEAINSMYLWYERAQKCYVDLSDLEPNAKIPDDIKRCRWLTRGWTLQELLAPQNVEFYNSEWQYVGSKLDLADALSRYTKIHRDVINGRKAPEYFGVATKMSWAAARETTRLEDMAYCLLGIFNVNMPLLYGEEEQAFVRLQETILEATDDVSIFAWEEDVEAGLHRSDVPMLAVRPRSFKILSGLEITGYLYPKTDFSMTNRGVYFSGSVDLFVIRRTVPATDIISLHYFLAIYTKEGDDSGHVSVCLRKCGPKLYYRERGIPLTALKEPNVKHIYNCMATQFWIAPRRIRNVGVQRLGLGRKGTLCVRTQNHWEIQEISPSDLRNWTDGFFFLPSDPPGCIRGLATIQALVFAGSFGGSIVHILVLCVRDANNGRYSANVSIRDKGSINDALIFNSSFTIEGVNAHQLLERDPRLLEDWSNSLQFRADDCEYEVSVSFVQRNMEDEHGRFRAWDLQLQTTTLGKVKGADAMLVSRSTGTRD